MKKIIAAILTACLILAPAQKTQAQDDKDNAIIAGCVAIACGGFIVYSLYTLCSKLPDPNQPPPPPIQTNTPITRVNWTNFFGPGWRGAYPPPGYVSPKGFYSASFPVHTTAIASPIPFDTSQWQASPFSSDHAPLVSSGAFDSYWSVTMESSTDLQNWSPRFQAFVYQCPSSQFHSEAAGVLINVYAGLYDSATNSHPIFSGYRSEVDMMCLLPQDCFRIEGDKQQEFFRFVQP